MSHVSPHRQWCWVEFHPAFIMAEHRKWRVIACELEEYGCFSVVLLSYNDQHCDFTSKGEIWSRDMSIKGKYQSHIFRRDAGWKSTGDAGWKSLPPSIKPWFDPLNLTYSPTSKAMVPLHIYLWIFLNIYMHQIQTFSPIINSRVKFLAYSSWPCWMLGGIPPSITVWGIRYGWLHLDIAERWSNCIFHTVCFAAVDSG